MNKGFIWLYVYFALAIAVILDSVRVAIEALRIQQFGTRSFYIYRLEPS